MTHVPTPTIDQSHLERMLMAAPFAVVIYDGPDHVVAFSNEHHEQMTSRRMKIGVPMLESMPELAGQSVIHTLDRVYTTGEPEEIGEALVKLMREGTLTNCWFQLSWQPTRDSSGSITGVFVTAIEVTQHVQSRQALHAARVDTEDAVRKIRSEQQATEAAIRDSERQVRDLVDNLPELAWSAGEDGTIDFYNRSWYAYTGTAFEEMQGWGWRTVHDPSMLDAVTARWAHSLASGQPFEMEFPLRSASGEFRWFLTRVRPLRDARGKILRWIGTNTDINDRRRAAEEREKLVAELTRALAMRDEFLLIASHELRTPLTTLRLQLDAAMAAVDKLEGTEQPRLAKKLAVAYKQMHRLIDLVGTFDEANAADRLQLNVERVDLGALVREVVERHEVLAASAGSTLEVSGCDATIIGQMDRSRIDQVLSNLIENAIKYGQRRPIELAVSVDGGDALVAVRDRGIGIPKEDHDRILGRFERAVPSKHYGGFGLGLYIANQLVVAHGGTLTIVSEPDRGSTFTMRLPTRS